MPLPCYVRAVREGGVGQQGLHTSPGLIPAHLLIQSPSREGAGRERSKWGWGGDHASYQQGEHSLSSRSQGNQGSAPILAT